MTNYVEPKINGKKILTDNFVEVNTLPTTNIKNNILYKLTTNNKLYYYLGEDAEQNPIWSVVTNVVEEDPQANNHNKILITDSNNNLVLSNFDVIKDVADITVATPDENTDYLYRDTTTGKLYIYKDNQFIKVGGGGINVVNALPVSDIDVEMIYELESNNAVEYYVYNNNSSSWKKLLSTDTVDNETLELDNNGLLTLKDGNGTTDGVKFNHLNTNLYNSNVANENNKLPTNQAVYNELLDNTNSSIAINANKIDFDLKNISGTSKITKSINTENTIDNDNTKIPNNAGVYKELLNNTNSVFEYDNTDASKDVINLKLQNNNSTDKIDKTIDFNDKLVLETKIQTITNKTIDVDNNTLSNIETDNFKSGVISTRLTTDYYFSWEKDNAYVYTKTANDEASVNCYTITITDGEVSAITLLGQGTIASGVLTYNSVEYSRDVNNDGFYVVNEKSKLIAISALSDIMEKAGKVNDIQLNSNSLVENKVANIIGLTNINNDYYYKWVNGSTYKYTKIRTIGASNVNVYTFTITDNVLTKITLETVKGSIALHSNGKDLELTWNSTKYILDNDYADSQYYIVGKEKQLLTGQLIESNKDFSKCWENVNFIKMNDVVRYTGNDAFVYRTTASGGYTISGDYNSNTPRTLWIQGNMAHLNFCCKGSVTTYGATWTYLGTIPAGKRPKYQFTILGMVYNGSENEAAGGYVTTSGDVVLWTNAKSTATNNYQARVSCSYQLQ